MKKHGTHQSEKASPSIFIPLPNFVNFHAVSCLKLLGNGLKPGLIISFSLYICMFFNASSINKVPPLPSIDFRRLYTIFYFTLNRSRCQVGLLTVRVHHLLLAHAIISAKFSITAPKINSERALWLG